MTTATLPTRTAPRTVPLNRTEKVLLAVHDGYVEAAYYRLRRPTETGDALQRFANRRRTLEDALAAIFADGDSPHHVDTTARYIRSTAWGADLP